MSRPIVRVGPPHLHETGVIPPRFVSYCRAATTVIAATLGFGALILTFIAILTLNGMRPALGDTLAPPGPDGPRILQELIGHGAEYR